METRYIKIVVGLGIILGLIFLISFLVHKKVTVKSRHKVKISSPAAYKPLLNQVQSAVPVPIKKLSQKTETAVKKNKSKTVNKVKNLSLKDITPAQRQMIEDKIQLENKKYHKYPSLEELDNFKKNGIIIR